MAININLKIVGINTHGLKSNSIYIDTLIRNNDIIFICEHWLSNAEKCIVTKMAEPTHDLYFNVAEKKYYGRPYGGNCFLVRKNIAENILVLYEDHNILAIQLKTNHINLIVIGVYLPSYHDNTSTENYINELNHISSIINTYIDESEIIIIGDFQAFPTDIYDGFKRNNTTRNNLSSPLKLFIQENCLELVDITNGSGPKTTYQHKTLPHSSYIDHIAVLKETSLSITSCLVHDRTLHNMSDHQPVSLSIKQNPTYHDIVNKEYPNNNIPKYAWKDDNFLNTYNNEVSDRLDKIQINDINIESSCNMINEILCESANKAFNICFSTRKKCSFSKKWWTPEISRTKQILSTHFNLWKEDGFPKTPESISHNRFMMSRKNFRKAIKNAQNETIYKKYSDINSLKNTKPKNFWKEIRKLKNTNITRPFTINNKQSDEEITEEFADHFNTLLNTPRVKNIKASRPIPDNNVVDTFHINSTDIKEAISLLKLNKSPDPFGIVAEHIKFTKNDKLSTWLAETYNLMFRDSTTAKCLSISTILPHVKSYKKSLKSPNNYRGISIIPILTKLLEYLILIKCPTITESHPAQYGFKQNSSTLHAEFIISETIKYYNKKQSSVYVCSLDAEKAFDSCAWNILLEKLYYEKNIPLPVVKIIESLYRNGTNQVRYQNNTSYKFNTSQGVRQGSILSPHLYNIYMEELLKEIEVNCDTGTTLYGYYSGIVAYADDIILLSPTLNGLQKMINKCTEYNESVAIRLNCEKTEFIVSGTEITNTYISMDGYRIKPQNRLKHLGFIWNVRSNKSHLATLNDENIQERINKFWTVIYTLIKGGIRFCHPHTIGHLFKTLAIPTLSYGLELCDLTDSQLRKLDTEGRKALKHLLNISKHSRNYLNNLLDIHHISTLIIKNKLNLFTRLTKNNEIREIILSIIQEKISYPSFTFDIFKTCTKLGINFYELLINRKYPKLYSYHDTIPEDIKYELTECITFWNIPQKRLLFKILLEENIPVVDT